MTKASSPAGRGTASTPGIPSLQRRFAGLAAIIILAVLLGAAWGYFGLLESQRASTERLREREAQLRLSQFVRAELMDAYGWLDEFVLAPSRINLRERIEAKIISAIDGAQSLGSATWVNNASRRVLTGQLVDNLAVLRRELFELFAVRLDTERQYPSMAVGAAVMGPNRTAMSNAFYIVFNEMRSEQTQVREPEVYEHFVRARVLWMQALSDFRIYLANRVGSFDEAALLTQEEGVSVLIDELGRELSRLDALERDGRVGFESGVALHDMRVNSHGWYEGFLNVREIHRSNAWRMDAKLLEEQIGPAFRDLNKTLGLLDAEIFESVGESIAAVTEKAELLTRILWAISILGVIFIATVMVSMNRWLFRPLALLTAAIKAEAMNRPATTIMPPATRETRDLLDAFQEMRQQIHSRQNELQYRSLHDELTALANRALLLENLQNEIHRARRKGETFSLLIIDLDRFKEVNDTLGHHVGDRLLIEVAARIRAMVQESDTVARLGGDEFAVLLPESDGNIARDLAEQILRDLKREIEVNDMRLYAVASIGIALYPEHGADPQTLLQHADVAMYSAKQRQSGHAFYDPTSDEYSVARLAMINDLRGAIGRGDIRLVYQPQVAMADGDVVGVEALLRWTHHDYGVVAPELVVELAEQTGMIHDLTQYVVDHALRQAKRWERRGHVFNVAVNFSMLNLDDGGIIEMVRESLARHAVAAERLVIEVTESAVAINPQQAGEVLRALAAMGIGLAIDDFGTGFSSLSRIKELPVRKLKIDKSFILFCDRDRSDRAIVEAALNLARNLELEVVAEGVESAQIWELLGEMGCDQAQGYLISRPLAVDEFDAWLSDYAQRRRQRQIG